MPLGRYFRIPFAVEAWVLNPEELKDIAKWCNGKVKGYSIAFPKIRNNAIPLDSQERKSWAVVGEVIVKTREGFVRMTKEEFNQRFTKEL